MSCVHLKKSKKIWIFFSDFFGFFFQIFFPFSQHEKIWIFFRTKKSERKSRKKSKIKSGFFFGFLQMDAAKKQKSEKKILLHKNFGKNEENLKCHYVQVRKGAFINYVSNLGGRGASKNGYFCLLLLLFLLTMGGGGLKNV